MGSSSSLPRPRLDAGPTSRLAVSGQNPRQPTVMPHVTMASALLALAITIAYLAVALTS